MRKLRIDPGIITHFPGTFKGQIWNIHDKNKKFTTEAENAATTTKENYIKQQQYLDARFTGIDTKLNLQTEELKAANKNIESASAKIIKETKTNRILLILLILGVGLSLLFNLAKFIM